MVLWVGANLVLQGQLSLGQLIAFRILSGYVTKRTKAFNDLATYTGTKVSFERLADIIDTPEESDQSTKTRFLFQGLLEK